MQWYRPNSIKELCCVNHYNIDITGKLRVCHIHLRKKIHRTKTTIKIEFNAKDSETGIVDNKLETSLLKKT